MFTLTIDGWFAGGQILAADLGDHHEYAANACTSTGGLLSFAPCEPGTAYTLSPLKSLYRKTAMLVLSRKVGESFRIGDQVTVTVLRVTGGAVRLGIEAPTHYTIVREELNAGFVEEEFPAHEDSHVGDAQ